MLADAAAMGAGKSDLMDKLQLRADNARAFEAKAAPCLATVEASTTAASTSAKDTAGAEATEVADADAGQSSASAHNTEAAASTASVSATPAVQHKVSLAELEALVQEGQGIGIKLDSLTDLTRLLNTARVWSQQAEFCLTGKEPQAAKNRKQHQRPSLERATNLVHELQSMAVLLPQAEELCSKQQQALKWVDKATHVLEQGNLGQHLADVQAVVNEGTAFGLEMPELTQLDALVKAIQWNSQVKAALKLQPHAQLQSSLPKQQEDTVNDTQQAGEQAQGPGLQSQQEGQPNDLPSQGIDAQAARIQAVQQPPAAAPAGPPADPSNTPVAERLTLTDAEALFEQGTELLVEEPLLQRLQELMESGQEWEAQVSSQLCEAIGRLLIGCLPRCYQCVHHS